MNAKEYLKKIKKYDMMISQTQEEINELRERLACVRSPIITDEQFERYATSGATFENLLAKIDALEQKKHKQIESYYNMREKIIEEINSIDNDVYGSILYKRYVECKSLEKIADEMNYSYDHMKHLHGVVLKYFEKKALHGRNA